MAFNIEVASRRNKSHAVTLSVGTHGGQHLSVGIARRLQIIDNVAHVDDAEYRNALLPLKLLDGRGCSRAALLPVETDGHTGQAGPRRFDHADDLTHGSAGGDYIVDHQHAPLQRCTDQRAALPVGFCLFAVVGKRHVAPVVIREGHGRRGGQRDAFIGRPEQYVEFNPGLHNALGVTTAERGQRRAAGERAGIKEVGADATRLEGEFTKLEDIVTTGELDELACLGLCLPHDAGIIGATMIHALSARGQE